METYTDHDEQAVLRSIFTHISPDVTIHKIIAEEDIMEEYIITCTSKMFGSLTFDFPSEIVILAHRKGELQLDNLGRVKKETWGPAPGTLWGYNLYQHDEVSGKLWQIKRYQRSFADVEDTLIKEFMLNEDGHV